MKSIISNERECLICKTPLNLHKHHIFHGAGRRPLSEKYGCWVYLCAKHHNMSDEGVHMNIDLDDELRDMCQREWEKRNGTTQDFIRIFGRSYLKEEVE